MLIKSSLLSVVLQLSGIVQGAIIKREEALEKEQEPEGLSKYVDVFFGTEGGGNVFPGSTRPFGMVKMGVDVIDSASGNAYSGYAPDGRITGISMMHESGTGGAPQYGVVSQLPSTGDNVDIREDLSQKRLLNVADDAHVGLYKTHLANKVNVTFAAADRSGVFEYEFPANETSNVIVNASHHLVAPARPWWTQYFVNGSIETSGDSLNTYSGHTTIKGGWGEQDPWTIYFYGEFSTTPQKVTSFKGDNKLENNYEEETSVEDEQFGLIFQFAKGTSIKSKVGISFISAEQAKENLYNDFEEHDFSTLKTSRKSQRLWNEKVFNKVQISNENSTLFGLVYTCLYGTHLLPSNRTGENPKWNSGEPYYDDWFTLWDTFRSTMPLFNVLQPKYSSEMVRGLIDIYRHDGYMPDGRSANQNGRTQGGSNSDIVLGDALVKNIDGINWEDGYAAMVKNAEVDPPYFYDSFSPDASTKEGRGGLSDWKSKGYISRDFKRSVTRTVEYSYNDYALSVVAEALGLSQDAEKYLKRSAGWQHLWNKNASSADLSYTGFLQPKNGDGSWATSDYDPVSCGGCYWGDDEYEGSPAEYGWAIPHDFQTLFKAIGDDEVVIQRLDDMFALHGKGFADIGNEPSFLTPYLYNYVGSQYRTSETIRYLINNRFSVGPKGLPGNSDAGSMQSWLFFGLIGLYPVASTTTYLLSAPFLERISLTVGDGALLDITTENFSPENHYVQCVEVNGAPWDKNWVTHDDLFFNGGSIKFVLGTEPQKWDTGAVPPSPGNYDLGLL